MKINLKYTYKLLNIILFIAIGILKLRKKLKILLCTIAKQENKYITEFVEHYQKMKIKQIIIYDNNDIKGETFDKILKKYINNNFIKIINFRGFKQPQIIALNNCYEKYNKNFDWIAFYDIDEFLYINNYTNLNSFLSLSKFRKCQGILINWKYYGDNDTLYYKPQPLKQRFIKVFPTKNLKSRKQYYSAAKTIVKGGLKIKWGLLPHFIKNIINCRPDGKIIKNYFSPPQYSIAYLKHYITKSTEEFIERINRGDVRINKTDKYIKKRIYNYYFLFNNITKEKINLFKKRINIKKIFK